MKFFPLVSNQIVSRNNLYPLPFIFSVWLLVRMGISISFVATLYMLEPDQVSPKPYLVAEQTTSQSFGSLYGPALDLSSLATPFLIKTKHRMCLLYLLFYIYYFNCILTCCVVPWVSLEREMKLKKIPYLQPFLFFTVGNIVWVYSTLQLTQLRLPVFTLIKWKITFI